MSARAGRRRIVAVAANPSIDRLYEVDHLGQGAIHRPLAVVARAGGKGLNAARAAVALGARVTVVGIVAGRAGDWIVEQLAGLGIDARMALARGETRSCISILDRSTGLMTELYEPGDEIGPGAWDELEATVAAELARGDVGALTLSGSLPPGAPANGFARIARLVRVATAGGRRAATGGLVPILVDTYGPALAGVLAERPAVLKVNAAEAGEIVGLVVDDPASAAVAGRSCASAARTVLSSPSVSPARSSSRPLGRPGSCRPTSGALTRWAAATRSWPASPRRWSRASRWSRRPYGAWRPGSRTPSCLEPASSTLGPPQNSWRRWRWCPPEGGGTRGAPSISRGKPLGSSTMGGTSSAIHPEGDPVRDRRHFLVSVGMRDELKRRQDSIRSLFAGQRLDSVPIHVQVTAPAETTVRERYLDAEKQLDAALASALATWELAPSSDVIPTLFPDVGCSCLASAFGSQYYWGDDLEQTPGVTSPIITDLEQQVELLAEPDPYRDGWLPEGLRRVGMFADAGQGFFPVTLLDAAGGPNVAADLMGMTELLLAFYTAPDAVRRLLEKIQRLFLSTIRAGIQAAGGEQNIANTDFYPAWFPEGAKGHVSDDVSSAFGPNMYMQFSAPYHAQVFEQFGRGGLHNCGPHPSHAAYVDSPLSPRAIDAVDRYSHGDLANLKRSLRKKAFVYLGWEGNSDPIPWYRGIMEQMAPDVVVIPVINLAPTDRPEELCQALRPIADEYAKRMDWGWET